MSFYFYYELTALQIRRIVEKGKAIAILPIGSVEQHGPHLPVGTDCHIGQACVEGALKLAKEGPDYLLLPHLYYGLSIEHEGMAGTITLGAETLLHILEDMASSLACTGISNLVMITGHGGNEHILEVGARQIRKKYGINVFCLELFRCLDNMGVGKDDVHAGQFETSAMMKLHPQMVDEAQIKPEMSSSVEKWKGLADNRTLATQTWLIVDVAWDGVVGDPRTASAGLGEEWLAELYSRLAHTFDVLSETVIG